MDLTKKSKIIFKKPGLGLKNFQSSLIQNLVLTWKKIKSSIFLKENWYHFIVKIGYLAINEIQILRLEGKDLNEENYLYTKCNLFYLKHLVRFRIMLWTKYHNFEQKQKRDAMCRFSATVHCTYLYQPGNFVKPSWGSNW